MKLALLSLAATTIVALALPASAAAHATLVRSTPSDGAVLPKAPREVRLVFDDVVRPLGGAEAVRNRGGSVIAGRETLVSARVLVLPLRRGLPDGDYSVRWRALSDDGHVVEGVLAFAVGTGRASPISVLSAGGTGPSARSVVSRWLFLFGLLTSFGAAVFERFVLRRAHPRVAMLMLGAFVAAFLGASGLIPHEGGATRFGLLYEIGAVIALVGGAAAALSLADRRAQWVAPVAAAVLLPVPSLAGHALDTGHPRLLNAVVDVLHTGSAAIWIGGLVALALVFDRELARRFSALALGSVVVLSATGVVRAVYELSSVSELWSSGYGRALLVKTALLVILVGLGWVNRYRLIPRAGASLRLTVRAETVLVAGIVVAVALLTALPPGRRAEAARPRLASPRATVLPKPPAGALVQAAQDGKLAVAVAVQGRRLETIVLSPERTGVSSLRVAFLVRGKELRAKPCGGGCYAATAGVVPQSVDVHVNRSAVTFLFPRKRRSAAALVRRATAFFRRARSVVFDERLSSEPGNLVQTRWELVAPDRLSYSIAGGAQGIVIGTRRWDRVPGGEWTPSAESPLPQPTPTWGSSPTNAYVLASRPRSLVVSFFDPQLYAWFRLTIDRRTARPSEMLMTAAAHFMRQHYLAYNRPVRIRPPS
jgi:copper transport protein